MSSCDNNKVSNSGITHATNDVLVVGMECAYQPFNWTVNSANEYTLPIDGTNQFVDGYDIAIARYLGEYTGKQVVIKKLEWDSLIPALQQEEINLVLAGMTDTPERRQSIDFSDPYLTSDLAFLISSTNRDKFFPDNSADNPATYEELLEAFRNQVLICQKSVVGDGFIDTYFANQEGYNITHASPLDTYPLAANDVKSGNAFAMPAELPVVEAMTNLGGLSVLYVDASFLSAEDQNGLSVSIGIKKGNTELQNEINEALAALSVEERQEMMGEAANRSGQTSEQGVWDIIWENVNYIGYGIISTIILALFGTGVGLIIGIFIAYGKGLKIKDTDKAIIKFLKGLVLGICQIYSTVLRGTPMMVQALIFKYGCQAIGINWNLINFPGSLNNVLNGWLFAGLIVITLNTAAYMGEIVRSGMNGVDQGQYEGARSLGMSASRTSLSIILPQALRNALPTIGNELIVNIKDSSVLNVIAVTELFYRLNDIATTYYAFIESYVILAVIYLILTLIATLCLKLVEKKMDGVKFSFNPFRFRRGEL